MRLRLPVTVILQTVSLGLIVGSCLVPLKSQASIAVPKTATCPKCVWGGSCLEYSDSTIYKVVPSGTTSTAYYCVDYDGIPPGHCASFTSDLDEVYAKDVNGNWFDTGSNCVNVECDQGVPDNHRPCYSYPTTNPPPPNAMQAGCVAH